ncbi:MAG: hypothetical protein AAB518_02350 [Patescibacteria group bacterium]
MKRSLRIILIIIALALVGGVIYFVLKIYKPPMRYYDPLSQTDCEVRTGFLCEYRNAWGRMGWYPTSAQRLSENLFVYPQPLQTYRNGEYGLEFQYPETFIPRVMSNKNNILNLQLHRSEITYSPKSAPEAKKVVFSVFLTATRYANSKSFQDARTACCSGDPSLSFQTEDGSVGVREPFCADYEGTESGCYYDEGYAGKDFFGKYFERSYTVPDASNVIVQLTIGSTSYDGYIPRGLEDQIINQQKMLQQSSDDLMKSLRFLP